MAGYCYRLDQQTSARFNDEAIRTVEYLDWIPRRQRLALAWRDLRARFYQRIRHPVKPHLRSGDFAIWRRDYERVNGFDENFEGWGCEDDDMNRRLRRAGVRVESILRWTRTCHLWHPRDVTYPTDRRDFRNRDYCNRKGKLTRCINGLHKRPVSDLAIRVAGEPSWPERASRLLEIHDLKPTTAARPEIEFLFLPGTGRFSGRADCHILVVLDDAPPPTPLVQAARLVITDQACASVPEEDRYRIDEFKRALDSLG
jgi:hypothetical protein